MSIFQIVISRTDIWSCITFIEITATINKLIITKCIIHMQITSTSTSVDWPLTLTMFSIWYSEGWLSEVHVIKILNLLKWKKIENLPEIAILVKTVCTFTTMTLFIFISEFNAIRSAITFVQLWAQGSIIDRSLLVKGSFTTIESHKQGPWSQNRRWEVCVAQYNLF